MQRAAFDRGDRPRRAWALAWTLAALGPWAGVSAGGDTAPLPEEARVSAATRAGRELAASIRDAVAPLTAPRRDVPSIDSFAHLVRRGSWTEPANGPDGTPAERPVDGELWNDAIAAALAAHGGVFLPRRDAAYYLDAPIVLASGQTLAADPRAEIRLKPGTDTCMVRNANPVGGQDGPLPADIVPDESITVEGGIWNAAHNAAGFSDARRSIPGAHGVLCFNNVRGLVVRKLTVRQGTPHAVQLANVSRFLVADIDLDDQRRDGIHVNGPARDGLLRDIRGVTYDDFVALNAWDWKHTTMTFGPIERVLVERLDGGDRGAASLRMLPGTKRFADGTTLDCPVRNCVFREIRGLNDIKAYDQPNLELGRAKDFCAPIGTLSGIFIEQLSIRRPRDPATIQIHAHADGIHVADVILDFPRRPTDRLVSIGPLSMTFTAGGNDPARWVEIFSPDLDCTVRNLTLENVRTAAGVVVPPRELVRVIEQRPNPDYPRTLPRGGTGRGIWIED